MNVWKRFFALFAVVEERRPKPLVGRAQLSVAIRALTQQVKASPTYTQSDSSVHFVSITVIT